VCVCDGKVRIYDRRRKSLKTEIATKGKHAYYDFTPEDDGLLQTSSRMVGHGDADIAALAALSAR
jgi:hypothetical protein